MRLTETLPTPATPLKPASTADVHAPQLFEGRSKDELAFYVQTIIMSKHKDTVRSLKGRFARQYQEVDRKSQDF